MAREEGGHWEGYSYFIPNGMEVVIRPYRAERAKEGRFDMSKVKTMLLIAILVIAFLGTVQLNSYNAYNLALASSIFITLALVSKLYMQTRLKRYGEPKEFNGLSTLAILSLLIMVGLAITCSASPGFLSPQELGGTLLFLSSPVLVDQALETRDAKGEGKRFVTHYPLPS